MSKLKEFYESLGQEEIDDLTSEEIISRALEAVDADVDQVKLIMANRPILEGMLLCCLPLGAILSQLPRSDRLETFENIQEFIRASMLMHDDAAAKEIVLQ